MNLGELRTELSDRGFDYLTDARLNRYINQAYHELCDADSWPFLQKTTSSTAPITFTDLKTVESVVNTTQKMKLVPMDRRIITDLDTDLTTTGTPSYYYITASSANPPNYIVNVYPANTTDTLAVRYWKIVVDLSADSSSTETGTPLVPTRWHYLIVDGAAKRAYQDSDNFDAANAIEGEWLKGVQSMRETLMVQNYDRPGLVSVIGDAHVGYMDY